MTALFSSCVVHDITSETVSKWGYLIAVLIFFAVMSIPNIIKNVKIKAIEKKFKAMTNIAYNKFTVTSQVDDFYGNFKLIVDDNAQEVIIMRSVTDIQRIPFADILSVEIMEKRRVLKKQYLKKAFIGYSGAINERILVSKIIVKIRIRNFTETAISLLCFDAFKASGSMYKEIDIKKSSYRSDYQKGLALANRITELLGVIIANNNRVLINKFPNPLASPNPDNKNTSLSIIDDLEKLIDMRDRGYITDKELATLKAKLLSD